MALAEHQAAAAFCGAASRLRPASFTAGLTWADERFLARCSSTSARRVRRTLREPFADSEFVARLEDVSRVLSMQTTQTAAPYGKKVLNQYALVRALQPEKVVETGVANGVSTSYVLLAMERNGKGHLHSIDIGDPATVPPGFMTGWAVLERLRKRWTMHLGDARALLPPLLERLGTIDLFIHDSLHTYEHMMFEFECAWPHIRPGGFLIADDALWNTSFSEFVRRVGANRARILRGVGFLYKAG